MIPAARHIFLIMANPVRTCHTRQLVHHSREQAAGRNAVWLQCSSQCIAACAP